MSQGEPGGLLTARLDKACEMAIADTAAPIVVSGRGESAAMKRYLVGKGIAPERILEEPLARSTNENLERSHALLGYVPLFRVITNDFHAVRTRLWAQHLGLKIEIFTAPTPWLHRPHNYTRELLATPHSALRVGWRKYRARRQP